MNVTFSGSSRLLSLFLTFLSLLLACRNCWLQSILTSHTNNYCILKIFNITPFFVFPLWLKIISSLISDDNFLRLEAIFWHLCVIHHGCLLVTQSVVPLQKELKAHLDQSSGRTKTIHTPHTRTARPQPLVLHSFILAARWTGVTHWGPPICLIAPRTSQLRAKHDNHYTKWWCASVCVCYSSTDMCWSGDKASHSFTERVHSL